MVKFGIIKMVAKELQEKLCSFLSSYFLTDVRNDREYYNNLSEEDFNEYPISYSGYILNLFLDGDLDKADELISLLPENSIVKAGLTIVNPKVDCREFIKKINSLKNGNCVIGCTSLTAGRPSVLNGFNDFTRLGSFLIRNKNLFIDYIQFLYGTDCATQIYNLALAEYNYQINNLIEAEMIVSQTIKSFDKNNEFRFLFVALFLEAKIGYANGTILKSSSYIKNINERIKKIGKTEFSYNIDATSVLFSLLGADYNIVSSWLKTDAPDEIGDFNMLDLYRYMVKIRCYIVNEEQSSAIALIEKLRPLLLEGRRHMDLCELDLLLTEALWSSDKKDLALISLERALKIAKRRNYIRLVADEGNGIFDAIKEYAKQKGTTPFLLKIIELTRREAILYPLYLRPRYKNNETFSQQEVDFLNLLQQGKNYEEIADYFFISTNTVKYHLKKIYMKLESENANQAVWKAKLLGLIK